MSLVLYELRDHISYITLNRPEKLNAIDPEMRDNPDVWLAIITGQGTAFCTGHDLVAMAERVERPGATTGDLYIMEASI